MNFTKFGTITHGLGDILILTSVCKYFPKKFIVQLPQNKKRFSILFEGLAEVEITDSITPLPDLGYGHYSTTKLRNFFNNTADFLDNRPLVLYSDAESEIWAKNYLQNLSNPIIFVPNCSKQHHAIRSLPQNLSDKIYGECIKNNLTPVVCEFSDNKTNYSNCLKLCDLDLKKYVCLLRRCGRYIGANTGDMHLAISVGCLTNVYQPNDCFSFSKDQWNYNHPSIIYNYF